MMACPTSGRQGAHHMKLKIFFYSFLFAVVPCFASLAHAQTFSVIHNFTGGADGAGPRTGVTINKGALYGTTFQGGSGNTGAIYQIKKNGDNWVTVPVFNFPADGSGGTSPWGRVLFGQDGHIYGTTYQGGPNNNGVVFSLTPPSSVCKTVNCQDFWKEQVLHSFGVFGDGHYPTGDLLWDQQGNIYGTTNSGGSSYDVGAVYEMTPSQNGWTESLAYAFGDRPDPWGPDSGVISDANGNLFGTSTNGGTNNTGTVFELKYVVGVGWTETTLYNFLNEDDGSGPFGGLVMDGSGNLFGTTVVGYHGVRDWTIFELSPAGDTWTYKLLYTGTGAIGPVKSLAMDAAGNLYGTTAGGGSYYAGNVFKLSNTENGWVYTSLYDFTGGNDGHEPVSNVSIDTDGTLYGTASYGGLYNQGVVWMIKP